MKLSQDSRQYSIPFIGTVGVVTVAMAVIAWFFHDRTLALSAAVLGLYSLHLISIRFIIEGQAENTARLATQWRLLQLLVDPNALEAGDASEPRRSTRPYASTPIGNLLATAAGNGAVHESSSGAAREKIPTPRHFALGTVALIRGLMTPAEVARVLIEQRNQPDERFAAIAVELGLVNEEQREELLLAQQEGLFTDHEMREARERLREFRQATARALSAHD